MNGRTWVYLYTLIGDSFQRNAQNDTKAFQLSTQAKECTLKARKDIIKSISYKTMYTMFRL